MLALKDEANICAATVPALAKLCNLTIDDCEKYLTQFQKPDKYSRSQDFDGRRIEKVEGGFLILNGQKYRELLRGQERRDYVRRKVAEHRARVNKCKQSNQCKPIAEAEAEAEAEGKKKHAARAIQIRFIAPSLDDCQKRASEIGLSPVEAEKFHNFYSSKGWKVGKNQMVDWHKAMAGWKLRITDGNKHISSGTRVPCTPGKYDGIAVSLPGM